MLRRGPTEDGPSTLPHAKRVRFHEATKVPTTSRVGASELSNRIGTWWMNPRMADVHFNVGPPDGVQELIPAHILVIAPASEVFNAMFLGSFDVPPTIDVPDGDPYAFKEMLRYVYTDRAVLTVGNNSDLLYLAKKYLLSGLIEQIVDYLKANIGCDNFSAAYQEAALHEEIREVQALRKCTLAVRTTGTVGAQTRRVTQIIGRKTENPDGTTVPSGNGERSVRLDSEPIRFTLSYETSRRVFAEILYRYVDDTIYGT